MAIQCQSQFPAPPPGEPSFLDPMDFRNRLSQDFAHMQSIIVKQYKLVHGSLMEVRSENQLLRAELDDVVHKHSTALENFGVPKSLFAQALIKQAHSLICPSSAKGNRTDPKPRTPCEQLQQTHQQTLENCKNSSSFLSSPFPSPPVPEGVPAIEGRPRSSARLLDNSAGPKPDNSSADLKKHPLSGKDTPIGEEVPSPHKIAADNTVVPEGKESVSAPERVLERRNYLVSQALTPTARTTLKKKVSQRPTSKRHEAWLRPKQTLERTELEQAQRLSKIHEYLDPSTNQPQVAENQGIVDQSSASMLSMIFAQLFSTAQGAKDSDDGAVLSGLASSGRSPPASQPLFSKPYVTDNDDNDASHFRDACNGTSPWAGMHCAEEQVTILPGTTDMTAVSSPDVWPTYTAAFCKVDVHDVSDDERAWLAPRSESSANAISNHFQLSVAETLD